MEGYNITFKVDGKTLCGRTQDDLAIAAITKESQTKDDQGAKRTRVVGQDVTFNCAGLVEVKSSGETTKLDANDVMDLALKTGDDAVIPVTYARGGNTYTGNAVITNYSETSNAEDEATYGLNMKVTGKLTKQA